MMNIIDYLRTSKKLKLLPEQEYALSIIYGLPTSDQNNIELRSEYSELPVFEGDEEEYRKHLRTGKFWNGVHSRSALLAAGRGGGKTLLQVMVMRYEIENVVGADFGKDMLLADGESLCVEYVSNSKEATASALTLLVSVLKDSLPFIKGSYKVTKGKNPSVLFTRSSDGWDFLNVHFTTLGTTTGRSSSNGYLLMADYGKTTKEEAEKHLAYVWPAQAQFHGARVLLSSDMRDTTSWFHKTVLREVGNGESTWCTLNLPAWWLNGGIPGYFLENRREEDSEVFSWSYRGNVETVHST